MRLLVEGHMKLEEIFEKQVRFKKGQNGVALCGLVDDVDIVNI